MDAPGARRTRTPLWLIEGVDVVELRRGVLVSVVGGVVAVGALLAWLAPGVVPPTPLVGAAVALAALLLGLAAAVAVDAADPIVHGPRHVRATGADLLAVLSTEPSVEEAAPLVPGILEARAGGRALTLGLAPVGRGSEVIAEWSRALGVALARWGVTVLHVDLAAGRSRQPGLAEVIGEDRRLGTAVSFDDELQLARMGAGHDLVAALAALSHLPRRLPSDLDVLLVSLPPPVSWEVVSAARALDHTIVVAQREVTARVDVIAALDALEGMGADVRALLLDDVTLGRSSPGPPPPPGAARAPAARPGPGPPPPGVVAAAEPARGRPRPGTPPAPAPETGPEPRSDPAPRDAVARHDEPIGGPARPGDDEGEGAGAWQGDVRLVPGPAPPPPPRPVARPAAGSRPDGDERPGQDEPAAREGESGDELGSHSPVAGEPASEEPASGEPPSRAVEPDEPDADRNEERVVPRRDAAVLHGLEAARAKSYLTAPPVRPHAGEPAVDDDAADADDPRIVAGPLAPASPEPDRARPRADVHDLASSGGEPDAPRDPAVDLGEEDPLRVTAKLSLLLDELEDRDQRS